MDPSLPSRFPTWAKHVGWLGFGLWAVAMLGTAGRWWLMKSAHLRVQALVAAGPKPTAAPGSGGADALSTAASSLDPTAPPGTPARELPLIGPVLSGDVAAYTALDATLKEINDLIQGLGRARKQGLWSFKEGVVNLGLEGAETMSEEAAAAEFLRRAGRFDDFLRRWQEALALGPWDFNGLEMFRSPGAHTEELKWNLLFRLSTATQGLWGLLAQAAWSTGDNSTTTNLFNSLAIALTSRQQIEDNIAMLHHSMDQPLAHFDLRTGVLQSIPPTPHEGRQNASLTWFDKYYLQYSRLAREGLAQSVPQLIVRSQSELDQTRLAASVELHHRSTGHYPESLDDVAARFPDGLPSDPATGDPYLYQRTGETGYRLWGRGVDRADNGGDRRSDVLWMGGREPSP